MNSILLNCDLLLLLLLFSLDAHSFWSSGSLWICTCVCFKIYFIFIYVSVHVHMSEDVHRGQKRALDLMGLDL